MSAAREGALDILFRVPRTPPDNAAIMAAALSHFLANERAGVGLSAETNLALD